MCWWSVKGLCGVCKTQFGWGEGRWHLEGHKALPFNPSPFLRRTTVVSSAMKSLPCLLFKKDNAQNNATFSMLILAPTYTAGTYKVSSDSDLFLLTVRITMLTENYS